MHHAGSEEMTTASPSGRSRGGGGCQGRSLRPEGGDVVSGAHGRGKPSPLQPLERVRIAHATLKREAKRVPLPEYAPRGQRGRGCGVDATSPVREGMSKVWSSRKPPFDASYTRTTPSDEPKATRVPLSPGSTAMESSGCADKIGLFGDEVDEGRAPRGMGCQCPGCRYGAAHKMACAMALRCCHLVGKGLCGEVEGQKASVFRTRNDRHLTPDHPELCARHARHVSFKPRQDIPYEVRGRSASPRDGWRSAATRS